MILWSFKEHVRNDKSKSQSFRWTLQTLADSRGVLIGFIPQHKINEFWYSDHTPVYTIEVTKRIENFSFGIGHAWYDGPHCFLSLGPIHFCWAGDPRTGRCKKCEADAGIT